MVNIFQNPKWKQEYAIEINIKQELRKPLASHMHNIYLLVQYCCCVVTGCQRSEGRRNWVCYQLMYGCIHHVMFQPLWTAARDGTVSPHLHHWVVDGRAMKASVPCHTLTIFAFLDTQCCSLQLTTLAGSVVMCDLCFVVCGSNQYLLLYVLRSFFVIPMLKIHIYIYIYFSSYNIIFLLVHKLKHEYVEMVTSKAFHN
jgi:hypothetical protein